MDNIEICWCIESARCIQHCFLPPSPNTYISQRQRAIKWEQQHRRPIIPEFSTRDHYKAVTEMQHAHCSLQRVSWRLADVQSTNSWWNTCEADLRTKQIQCKPLHAVTGRYRFITRSLHGQTKFRNKWSNVRWCISIHTKSHDPNNMRIHKHTNQKVYIRKREHHYRPLQAHYRVITWPFHRSAVAADAGINLCKAKETNVRPTRKYLDIHRTRLAKPVALNRRCVVVFCMAPHGWVSMFDRPVKYIGSYSFWFRLAKCSM